MKIETITKFSATAAILIAFNGVTYAGNGAPSGGHYNLNIRGTDHCPGDDMKGSNTHVIHVLLHSDVSAKTGDISTDLDRTNKIFLEEAEDFRVTDGNACDGDGAVFQLPANPFDCPVLDGEPEDPECLDHDPTFQAYTVWARALGKPGGGATVTTCATDPSTGLIVCSSEQEVFVRKKGKSSFRDVTKALTTIRADLDGDGTDERVGLFEDELQDYFWDYDNNGLRLLQMRFYPVAD